jgi:hypothetical protein
LGESHRQVDGGVVRNLEPQNLRRAKQQDCLSAWRVGRKSLFQKSAKQMAQGAEPTQDSSYQPAGQGAVAIGKGRQTRMCVLAGEEVVERYPPP